MAALRIKTPFTHVIRLRQMGVTAFACVVLLAGCSGHKREDEVRNLRVSGQPDSARALALSQLSTNRNRLSMWLEFAQSSLDAVRLRPREESHANDTDILVTACIVCSAVYQDKKHEPPREWHDTGRLVSAELARQINDHMTTMTAQMESASYLKPLLTPSGQDTLQPMPSEQQTHAQKLMAEYRLGSRNVLFWTAAFRHFMELLPEVNPGTTSLLSGQLDEATASWARTLDLDPAFMGTMQQRGRQEVDQAVGRAMQDLKDLGYFLPETITENGVNP